MSKVSELTASRGKLFHSPIMLLKNEYTYFYYCNEQKGLCKHHDDDCTSDYMKMTLIGVYSCHI